MVLPYPCANTDQVTGPVILICGFIVSAEKDGRMNSVDWSGGMEYWSGVLDWTTGVGGRYFKHAHSNQRMVADP